MTDTPSPPEAEDPTEPEEPTAPEPASVTGALVRGLAFVAAGLLVGVIFLGDADPEVEAAPPTTTAAPTASSTTVPPTTTTTTTTTQPTTTTTEPPDDPTLVRVKVANGQTGVGGSAGRLTARIAELDYQTEDATNTTGEPLETSRIQYLPGYDLEAQVLAESLGWPADVTEPMPDELEITDLGEAHLLVLLGRDFAE